MKGSSLDLLGLVGRGLGKIDVLASDTLEHVENVETSGLEVTRGIVRRRDEHLHKI